MKKPLMKTLALFSLAALFLLPAAAGAEQEATHLWPAAALHFAAPAAESETFRMTEEEYAAALQRAELQLSEAYSAYHASLPAEQQALLAAAQEAWRAALELNEPPLREQLDSGVLVYYGQAQEHKTNIYRDTMLSLREQRSAALLCWAQGRYACLPQAKLATAEEELAAARETLLRAYSDNLYVMDEKFRDPTQQARAAWLAFLAADQAFLQAVTHAETAICAGEALRCYQELSELVQLQRQGSIFFHREREE